MKKLKDVNIDDIQILFNSFAYKGFSRGMIKLVAATLNGCFTKAIKKRMIEFNPVEYAEIPDAKPKKKSIALTKEIQNVFQEYARDSYLFSLFRIGLMTGLRCGELRGLCWSDIDFLNKKVNVTHTLIWIEGQGYYLDTPKTERSVRKIPMNADLLKYMEELKAAADDNGLGGLKNHVFSLPDSTPISRFRVTNELNKVQNNMFKAGFDFKRFTCHALRHTFATRTIENGINPQTLKSLLGHANLAMTMDLYSHVMEDTRVSEMDKLNGVF